MPTYHVEPIRRPAYGSEIVIEPDILQSDSTGQLYLHISGPLEPRFSGLVGVLSAPESIAIGIGTPEVRNDTARFMVRGQQARYLLTSEDIAHLQDMIERVREDRGDYDL